jgi:hypothetical protein
MKKWEFKQNLKQSRFPKRLIAKASEKASTCSTEKGHSSWSYPCQVAFRASFFSTKWMSAVRHTRESRDLEPVPAH